MKSFQRKDAEGATAQRGPTRIGLCVFAFLCAFALNPIDVASAEPPSFKRDIAPILLNNCLACHGPKKSEGGYRIDTFERLKAAGDSTQPGFAAKDLEGSEAFRRITST